MKNLLQSLRQSAAIENIDIRDILESLGYFEESESGEIECYHHPKLKQRILIIEAVPNKTLENFDSVELNNKTHIEGDNSQESSLNHSEGYYFPRRL